MTGSSETTVPQTKGESVGRFMLRLIRLYQRTAHLRPPVCRFSPSCSEYAAQAITRFGPRQGIWLALKRMGRCHPFHQGGYDPCPEKNELGMPLPVSPVRVAENGSSEC